MKSFKLIVLIFLCSLNSLVAQDNYKKIKIYKIWVALNNQPLVIRGVLYEVKDSSIIVTNSHYKKDYSINNFTRTELNFKEIKKIKISRKGRFLRCILNGTVIGFAFGAFIGLSSKDTGGSSSGFEVFSDEEMVFMLGGVWAAQGMIIGALIGSSKVKAPVYGDYHNFEANKYKLRNYSIRGQLDNQ